MGDDIHFGDKDGVGVMVRNRLRLRGRLARLTRAAVMMGVVMAAVAVVMAVASVTVGCSDCVRVDVRPEAVPGGLAPAVTVAEGG